MRSLQNLVANGRFFFPFANFRSFLRFLFLMIYLIFLLLFYFLSLYFPIFPYPLDFTSNNVIFFTILHPSHYFRKKWKFSISTSTSSRRKDRNWEQWRDSVFWSNMDRSVQSLFFLHGSCFDGPSILQSLQQKLRVQAL